MSPSRKKQVATQRLKQVPHKEELEKEKEKSKPSFTQPNSIELEALRIQREIEGIFRRLAEIEGEEKICLITKTEALRQLALNFERLHQLGKYEEPLSHICRTICRLLKEKNLWASESLAHRVLDDKFKMTEFAPDIPGPVRKTMVSVSNNYAMAPSANQENQDQEQTSSFSFDQSTTIPNFDFQPFAPMQQQQQQQKKKSLDDMTKEEIRELTEQTLTLEKQTTEQQRELRRRRREYIQKCIEQKIPLSDEFSGHLVTHISSQSDDSGMSEAVKAVYRHIEIWEKFAEKMIKYRPHKEMAEKIAFYLDAETDFIKAWCDEKYRKDTIGWLLTEIENTWHGKHGSAKRTATLIEGKDLPKPIERALTREQVGDKYESVYRQALVLQTAYRYKMEIFKWYAQYPEKKIAKRAYELGPVLSEKAFSGT